MTAEVELRSLTPGAVFYLDVELHKLRGVLIEINRGSCTVAVESRKPARVIRTADGRESAPIKQSDQIQHWCLETMVLPTEEKHDLERYLSKLKGETTMNDATTEVKAPRAKKAKAVKAPKATKEAKVKKILTTRYAVTAKAVSDKLDYENTENDGHNAVIYRFLAAAREPMLFSEIVEGIGKSFGSHSKNVESIFRWHLHDLMSKKGLVKSIEKREEVEAA